MLSSNRPAVLVPVARVFQHPRPVQPSGNQAVAPSIHQGRCADQGSGMRRSLGAGPLWDRRKGVRYRQRTHSTSLERLQQRELAGYRHARRKCRLAMPAKNWPGCGLAGSWFQGGFPGGESRPRPKSVSRSTNLMLAEDALPGLSLIHI